jgi:flagellar basal body-associated protein FliL
MKDFNHALAKTRFVALYANMATEGWFTVFEVTYVNYDEHFQPLTDGQKREKPWEGYVRISEPVKVDFAATDDDTVVRNAVASLDEQERKLRAELGEKLAQLQDRRNQLLALTHSPAVES